MQVAERAAQAIFFVFKHAVAHCLVAAVRERYSQWNANRHGAMVLSNIAALGPAGPEALQGTVVRTLPTVVACYEKVKASVLRDAVPLARRGSKYK